MTFWRCLRRLAREERSRVILEDRCRSHTPTRSDFLYRNCRSFFRMPGIELCCVVGVRHNNGMALTFGR
jgi:hypothetical protein